MSELLSIITPVYNGAKTLRRAINSVTAQANAPILWIIIDDGSSDNTYSLLQEIAKIVPKIKILHNKNNLGVSRSRKIALDHVTTPYVSFLDSDDALIKGVLPNVSKQLTDLDTDIYVADSKIYFPFTGLTKNYFKYSSHPLFKTSKCDTNAAFLALLANNGITPAFWDKIYKTDLLKLHWGAETNLKIGEDWLTNLRVMAHAKTIKSLNLYTYKWTFSGMGAKYYLDKWPQYAHAVELVYFELPKLSQTAHTNLKQSYKALTDNYLQHIREALA